MDLVTVTECQTDFDAKLVANYLEANGIRAYISGGPASLAGAAAGVPCGACELPENVTFMGAPKGNRVRSYNEPGHAHELTFSCFQGLQLLSKDRTRDGLV